MDFVDLKHQYQLYKEEIDSEIEQVLTSATFIHGPAIEELESQLATYIGIKHAIGCSSGTDALLLSLMAMDVRTGDEVIVPDFTFIATAEVVALLGAVPVFVDVEPESLNIDVEKIAEAVTEKTVGIIPVSLYGQCADVDEVNTLASREGLWVIEDAAQSFGATYKSRNSGTLCQIGVTSFFPAKPLGGYGDGGAVFVNNDDTEDKIRTLLNHGQAERYRHSYVGLNARLDSIQAAVLSVKLRHFRQEIAARQRVADLYSELLSGAVETPKTSSHNTCVWAQYTVRSAHRERILAALKKKGIPTAIHYPIPLHKQKCFAYLDSSDRIFPVTMRACNEVFSLPMHPFLAESEIKKIAESIQVAING